MEITGLTLPNPINGAIKQMRYLVSKDKFRFVDEDEGYDLDLTYITHKLIAMGYPSQTAIQSTYRNTIDDYATFLNDKHRKKYQVYNLTEEPYDGTKFENRVLHFSIDDHHSPSLSMLLNIMQTMEKWLKADEENVAVVHCKAGRGRTGTIISAFLMWSKAFDSADKALEFFALRRSSTGDGVEGPSQARYVHYVADISLKKLVVFPPKKLKLNKILMRPIPSFSLSNGCLPTIEIVNVESKEIIYVTPKDQWKTFNKDEFCAFLDLNLLVAGDLLVRFYHQPSELSKTMLRSSPMFRVGFHTSFVPSLHLDFSKDQLDTMLQGPLKDNRFTSDFSVRFVFSEFNASLLEDKQFEALQIH